MLLLVRHLLLEAMHLLQVANIVTTSKALVMLIEAMHLLLVANIVTTSKAFVTRSDALVTSSNHWYY